MVGDIIRQAVSGCNNLEQGSCSSKFLYTSPSFLNTNIWIEDSFAFLKLTWGMFLAIIYKNDSLAIDMAVHVKEYTITQNFSHS